MTERRLSGANAAVSSVAGFLLAGIWAVEAAVPTLRGTRYLLFLLPLALLGFIGWRSQTTFRARAGNKSGIVVGLCCWFVAGTLSTVLNFDTAEVVLTYSTVLLSGALIYSTLRGIELTPRDLDIAVVGLAIGTVCSLIAGLMAFYSEWGIPDIATIMTAWQDLPRMVGYEDATFGNRGNTAGFILIAAPLLLATMVDSRRRLEMRMLCGTALVPVALTLLVLQVRAAFITTALVIAVVWGFKRGVRRMPLFAGAVAIGLFLFFKFQPDAGLTMSERLQAAVTVDKAGDESVRGRLDAMQEGWLIASQNWLLGIGPGAALTVHSLHSAHQFQVQQAMETGVLGLLGVTLLTLGVWASVCRTLARGRNDEVNDTRFMLLVGPAAFVTYSAIANGALNSGLINTWTVLIASMLALMPAFERRPRKVRVRVERAASLRTLAMQHLLRRDRPVTSFAR